MKLRVPLHQLKRLKKRKSKNVFNLKVQTLSRAIFFLDREVLDDGLHIHFTRLKFPVIESITPISTNAYAYCPLYGKNKQCPHCSFKSGVNLNISEVAALGTFDAQKLTDFILNQIQIKFSFACRKVINPRYRFADSDASLVIFKSPSPGINLALLGPANVSKVQAEYLYAHVDFSCTLKMQKLGPGAKLLYGDLRTLASRRGTFHTHYFMFLLSQYLHTPSSMAEFVKLAKEYRISHKKLGALIPNYKFLLDDLTRAGYLTYSSYRHYPSRKLKQVLVGRLTLKAASVILKATESEKSDA